MEGERRRQKRIESLGWLTESTLMPKKHKAIEGVGAASIVELKAQLYRTQEEARKSKDSAGGDSSEAFHGAKKKPIASDLFSQKNSGVESRARKDKLEMKAIKDGSVSYAALEKKAELYEKLARGELPDEEENEKYCVDFFQKTLEHDEESCADTSNKVDVPPQNEDGDGDFALLSGKLSVPGETGVSTNRDEHKRFVREVHEEANQARERTKNLKLLRQEQEVARREKLRQAYLKKQLQKVLSAKQNAATESDSSLPPT